MNNRIKLIMNQTFSIYILRLTLMIKKIKNVNDTYKH